MYILSVELTFIISSTTLLANGRCFCWREKQVIDLGSLKNQIGIIREPKLVIIDSQWLETLPKKELRSGFAEMLKHGLISDPSYWYELINIKKLDAITLAKYIKSSVAIKEKIVLKDPTRKKLKKNFEFWTHDGPCN